VAATPRLAAGARGAGGGGGGAGGGGGGGGIEAAELCLGRGGR
jgi:hypothetical protein